MKQDITHYSDNELSLLVFNDEFLYRQRHRSESILKEILDELFTYTEEQYEVLKQDLIDDEVGMLVEPQE